MNVWTRRILCWLLAMTLSLIGPLSAHAQTVVYFHNDPAGSPIAATDASGNVLWRESYRPYGERMLKPAAANTQWFHGKSLDPDTGMEDFGARNYDPVLGRFLSIDPVDFTEKNIHSFNRYTYGNNNPLKYKDPDGRFGFLLPLVSALSDIGLATAVRLTATTAGRYVVSGATAIAAGEVGVAYRIKTLENPSIVVPLVSIAEKPGPIFLSNGMNVSEAGNKIIKWGGAPEGALERIKNVDAIYLKEVYSQLKKEDFKEIANWYRGIADYLAKHNMDALKSTPTPLIRAELMDKIVDGAPK